MESLRQLFAGEQVLAAPSLAPSAPPPEPKIQPAAAGEIQALLKTLGSRVRLLHFSPSTEKTYTAWTERFLRRHAGTPLEKLGEAEVAAFLSFLATHRRVAASTQNQALIALLFLFKEVAGRELGPVQGVVRAKRPKRLPVVLARDEVRRLLGQMSGFPRLMATLLYGAGLRLMECRKLRVKDLDFGQNQIVVRSGKGDKDRCTMFPNAAQDPIRKHLEWVKRTLPRNGVGNGSSPLRATTRSRRPASAGVTTCTRRSCRRP